MYKSFKRERKNNRKRKKKKKNSMKTFYKSRFGFVRIVVPRGVQVKSQLSKDITNYKSRAVDSLEFRVSLLLCDGMYKVGVMLW